MAHMTSFWVVPVQLIPSFVKYKVIFAQTRNVLCCWYSWIPQRGCIHNARHGPVSPFTNQIKAATGFPISEKLFPKLKDKQNSFNSIKTYGTNLEEVDLNSRRYLVGIGFHGSSQVLGKDQIRYISGVQDLHCRSLFT